MSGLCEKCADKACPDYYPGTVECQDFRQMTNADSIRAMTDEELAVLLQNSCCRPDGADCPPIDDCEKCWLDWLKQEAEE